VFRLRMWFSLDVKVDEVQDGGHCGHEDDGLGEVHDCSLVRCGLGEIGVCRLCGHGGGSPAGCF